MSCLTFLVVVYFVMVTGLSTYLMLLFLLMVSAYFYTGEPTLKRSKLLSLYVVWVDIGFIVDWY